MLTADHTATTDCAVAPMAVEALGLVRALRRYDEHNCHDLWSRTAARLEVLETAAATAHAASAEGRFFQTCIAVGALDWWDTFEAAEADEQRRRRDVAIRAMLGVALASYRPTMGPLADYYLPAEFEAQVAA